MDVYELMEEWNISMPTAQFIVDRGGDIPPFSEFPDTLPDEEIIKIIMKKENLEPEEAAMLLQIERGEVGVFQRVKTIVEL